MNFEPITLSQPIPPELLAEFMALEPFTEEDYNELKAAATEVMRTPEFKADLLKERLYARIRARLRELKLSQAKLARRLGLPRAELLRRIHPDRRQSFDLDILARISQDLNLALELSFPQASCSSSLAKPPAEANLTTESSLERS
jgi:hypothetical protein